ncbi:MAG: hypothetical protein OXU77_07700 [Gammaproteobacteria bacterium]|nr:hypothetical protein [Gammaproteobacteria bacterium]MDE0441720.1 hypothetical protein [Gammaproteobacteria bacterium]
MLLCYGVIDEQHVRDELRDELASIGDCRPGVLVEMTRKCGKPTCHCAREGDPGHPGWALSRMVGGKRVNRGIPVPALEQTRAQIAEHARFKELCGRFVEASEELCRARLKAGQIQRPGRNTPTSLIAGMYC